MGKKGEELLSKLSDEARKQINEIAQVNGVTYRDQSTAYYAFIDGFIAGMEFLYNRKDLQND